MPVIVVGADTTQGLELLEALHQPGREIRAFVTDEVVAHMLREKGFKVALGDVSDDSHVEAAAMNCFSAVLITAAAHDDRERAFLDTPEKVLTGWARAVSAARVRRVIWLGDGVPVNGVAEVVRVDPKRDDAIRQVVDLDDAQTI
jgi:nucleoside-diphosphate-sugar epimerase